MYELGATSTAPAGVITRADATPYNPTPAELARANAWIRQSGAAYGAARTPWALDPDRRRFTVPTTAAPYGPGTAQITFGFGQGWFIDFPAPGVVRQAAPAPVQTPSAPVTVTPAAPLPPPVLRLAPPPPVAAPVELPAPIVQLRPATVPTSAEVRASDAAAPARVEATVQTSATAPDAAPGGVAALQRLLESVRARPAIAAAAGLGVLLLLSGTARPRRRAR